MSTDPSFLTSTYAQTHCTPEIVNIASAKAHHHKTIDSKQYLQWEKIEHLPDFWLKRWPDYQGDVWYKIVWRNPCPESKEPLSLVLRSISMGQIYLNVELLWQDRSLQEPLSRNWNLPRQWVLPTAIINAEQNIFLIRVIGVQTQPAGIGQLWIDQLSQNDI